MDKIKEIKRTIDDKSKAKKQKNFKEVSLLCNYLGDLYLNNGFYEKAIEEHKEELEYCCKLNDDLGIAVAYRKIGECYSELGEFSNALNFQHKYLALVEKLNNLVEIQRAWATLGRTYFMFYSSDPKINYKKLTIAKNAHIKALNLTNHLKTNLKDKDYAEMKCRAFLNLGLIYDQKDDEQECSLYFNRAISLAKQYGFKEDLYRCEISLATFYTKIGLYTKAIEMFNLSIISAKKLKNLINIYEVYLGKANAYLYMKDFENAKHCFKKAFFLFKNDCNESNEAKKFYNLTKQIIINIRELINQNSEKSKIKLSDKLGDIFVQLNCFSIAIEYYNMELNHAISIQMNKKKLAEIYLSLGQTYLDNKQYNDALSNFSKEFECIKGDVEEEVRVNLKLIEVKSLITDNIEEIINEYNKLIENQKLSENLKKIIYQDYSNFLNNLTEFKDLYLDLLNEIKFKLENLNKSTNYNQIEEFELEFDKEEETSFELKIEDVSDLTTDSESEENEEIAGQLNKTRKSKSKLEKKNEKGETLLHRACIEGNLDQVEKLIKKGHKINPRDNCGWLPIHEASNHGFVDIVKTLLKHKAWINDPGGRNCDGTTPLHDACTNGHVDVIRVLIKNGANVVCVDYHNNTPLDCLLGYLKRTEYLTSFEKNDFQLLIDQLKNEMKKCGFNEKKNLKRPFSLIEISNNLDIQDSDQLSLSDNDMLESPPRKTNRFNNKTNNINKEESKKCIDLRRDLYHISNNEFLSNKIKLNKKIDSLIDEANIVDDFLEDDIGIFKTKKKNKILNRFQNKNCTEVNVRCKNYNNNRIKNFNLTNTNNLNENLINNFSDSDSKDTSISNDEIYESQLNLSDNSIQEIKDDNSIKDIVTSKNVKRKQSKIKRYFNTDKKLTSNDYKEKLSNNSDETSALCNNKLTDIQTNKLKVRAHIDNMVLLIPIPSDSTLISWLINETVERYYSFKKIKPKIILTTQDGAFLSPDDKIVDVLNNMDVFVKIDAFDIKPLNDVYLDLCKKSGIDILVELELEYQTSMTSGCLCLQNCNLSEQQFNIFINSLKMQNKIRVLDLSFSNLVKQDLSYELLQSISSLSNLEVLNLECTGLNSEYLKQLSKLNLSKLNYLNLNYNFLASSSDSICELIKNFKNLYKLSLEFCDLTDELILNLNLNQLVEKRSIQIKIDPYLNFNSKCSKFVIDWASIPKLNDLDYQKFKKMLIK